MSISIALENQKPGAPQSEWMLQPGEASSSIEGFTTSMSTNLGNTVDFKINTDSNDYRIDIYRLGYYGGDGATLVTSIQHQAASAIGQPAPLTDPATGLVDAGNWSVTDSWTVPSDATSGVYIAKLTRLDGTGGENVIPFVVTDKSSTSDVVFQTPDATWEAYNKWGGSNLYSGARAVSYNRPLTTFSTDPGNSPFGPDLGAISWLEENGYDVSYISSVDVASDASSLLNHKIFLTSGHDEYWSAEQVANVQAARDAGVNLAFFGGNDVYWKTRWESSIDGSITDYRTLITYKTSESGVADPSGAWTGTWRDPNGLAGGGDKPENGLTGTIYMVNFDPNTPLAPLTISEEYSKLRIWDNTAISKLGPGQVYTTAGNYLGWEWNVDAQNGFRPAGLIDLSSTTIKTGGVISATLGQYVLPDPTGTATHNLTLYRAASGALVFSAGTIDWANALSDAGGDINIQQAMVNLFADMGAQPQSLDPNLVTASQTKDGAPPKSVITSDTESEFTSGQIATVSGSSVDLNGGIVAGVEVSIDGGTTWNLASLSNKSASTTWTFSWTPDHTGYDTILARAVDDSANLEHPKLNSNFAITDFYGDFSVAQGWWTGDTMRTLADLNGDGRADLVGFGDFAVFGAFGLSNDAQYNGGASLSPHVNDLVNDFGISQGYTQISQRGIDFVGNFGNAPADHFGTIWAVGSDGFHYNVVSSSSSTTGPGGSTYVSPVYNSSSRTYDDFGLAQGWSQNYTVQVAFLANLDSYASIVGFGDAGLLIGPQAFQSSAVSSQVYVAPGSDTLGNASGWDSTLDIRTVRDYYGNKIDINGDGIADFIGMGPNGLEYAFGQEGTPNSQYYSLGALQTPEIGPSGAGAYFGQAQGWDNTTTLRYIADINSDGHPDIVGFGAGGVYVSLGQTPNADGSGAFGTAYLAIADFGTDQGWSNAQNTRVLGDLYGNGKVDIVGFGQDYTFIAAPTTDPTTGHVTFDITDILHAYGTNEGYAPSQNFRGVADLTGTGIDSIIVSSATNTQILTHV